MSGFADCGGNEPGGRYVQEIAGLPEPRRCIDTGRRRSVERLAFGAVKSQALRSRALLDCAEKGRPTRWRHTPLTFLLRRSPNTLSS